MARWSAETRVGADPDGVLSMLTEPDAIARWAPVAFELDGFSQDRLRTGERVRVHGYLAGRCLAFEVSVDCAHDGRLALRATGPIRLDVAYDAVALRDGTSRLTASVAVSGSGLRGRVLAQATDALLAAGALSLALDRIARELEPAAAFACAGS